MTGKLAVCCLSVGRLGPSSILADLAAIKLSDAAQFGSDDVPYIAPNNPLISRSMQRDDPFQRRGGSYRPGSRMLKLMFLVCVGFGARTSIGIENVSVLFVLDVDNY